MKASYQLTLFLLGALEQISHAQLVIPPGLPSTSSNFRLRAHSTTPNSTLAARIENWTLATTSGQDSDVCNQAAVLVPDDRAGQTFFVHVESSTIHSGARGDKQAMLTLEEQDGRKSLRLECGEAAVSQVGVGFRRSAPLLVLTRDSDSQLYACRDDSKTVGVFYRERRGEALRKGCVDVELLLECATGPDRGKTELAACCARVRNGDCWPEYEERAAEAVTQRYR